jgi:aerobic carbon-monoxide dehydrogenase large subunit
MRGSIVHGIGSILFEEFLYDDQGSPSNENMADYLVPMAAEMPDIIVDHIQSPTKTSMPGAKVVVKLLADTQQTVLKL